MTDHAEWTELRERRMAEPDADEAYEAARIAFELRQALRELRRRTGRVPRRRPTAGP